MGCIGSGGPWAFTRQRRARRREVIQPQVPLRLPCYDFSPLEGEGFDPLPRERASPLPLSGGATGSVYKGQGRIHRAMVTRGY